MRILVYSKTLNLQGDSKLRWIGEREGFILIQNCRIYPSMKKPSPVNQSYLNFCICMGILFVLVLKEDYVAEVKVVEVSTG